MRVFILCTGRSGSAGIIKACSHIQNFTAGHETRTKLTGSEKFNYPDNHIEADNRLSWFLGTLEEKYGDNPVYFHLKRNKTDTVASFNRRWHSRAGIIRAFSEGILKTPVELLSKNDRLKVCEEYYDCVNRNIESFLKNKSKTAVIRLENIKSDFTEFWKIIGATGDLDAALHEFDKKHNKSTKRKKRSIPYELKLFGLRIWRIISG